MSDPTTSETTRIGIVGCGLIGRKRLANLPPGATVVVCHDVDPRRVTELAEHATGRTPIRVTTTADELFARADVDLVLLATTHDALALLALPAVSCGKHVLVEKPGADSLESLLELRDTAAAAGVCVRVGYNHRFHPATAEGARDRCLRAVRAAAALRARYGHGGRLGYEREWRADRACSGGGELIDQGSHLIDLVRAFFGDVDLAFAECDTAFWDMAVEDNAFVALRVRAGGFAWLHASWTEWKNLFSFEVTLARAKLEVIGPGRQLRVRATHPSSRCTPRWARPRPGRGTSRTPTRRGATSSPTSWARSAGRPARCIDRRRDRDDDDHRRRLHHQPGSYRPVNFNPGTVVAYCALSGALLAFFALVGLPVKLVLRRLDIDAGRVVAAPVFGIAVIVTASWYWAVPFGATKPLARIALAGAVFVAIAYARLARSHAGALRAHRADPRVRGGVALFALLLRRDRRHDVRNPRAALRTRSVHRRFGATPTRPTTRTSASSCWTRARATAATSPTTTSARVRQSFPPAPLRPSRPVRQ